MRQLIHQYDIFELLHVTDDIGLQITNNIAKVDFKTHYSSKGVLGAGIDLRKIIEKR